MKNKISAFWLWIIVILSIVSIIAISHFAFTIGEVWGYAQGYQDAYNTYLIGNLTNN